MDFETYKQTLLSAVKNEIEAYEFYHDSAEKTQNASLKAIFNELAREEMGHKDLLETYAFDELKTIRFNDVKDYRISESVELPRLSTEMSFVEGIALAMKKEEAAMNVYIAFARACEDAQQSEIFNQLARMEQGHKVKLEAIYNDTAFAQTAGG
ncbi:MAG: ferritin family protein [Spirochaetes bacterium]|nr:ferritin family protein [Spirochaetota bacterium]